MLAALELSQFELFCVEEEREINEQYAIRKQHSKQSTVKKKHSIQKIKKYHQKLKEKRKRERREEEEKERLQKITDKKRRYHHSHSNTNSQSYSQSSKHKKKSGIKHIRYQATASPSPTPATVGHHQLQYSLDAILQREMPFSSDDELVECTKFPIQPQTYHSHDSLSHDVPLPSTMMELNISMDDNLNMDIIGEYEADVDIEDGISLSANMNENALLLSRMTYGLSFVNQNIIEKYAFVLNNKRKRKLQLQEMIIALYEKYMHLCSGYELLLPVHLQQEMWNNIQTFDDRFSCSSLFSFFDNVIDCVVQQLFASFVRYRF